ncbi:hypothetical protein K466DRAFT_564276 [Polyporus arcularius HHB13444]|uniref:Uncharacterized protein n=1 Tax=Polyporus arcularius HHB13444 TaxID=1314778 RepID=A0A5C3PSV3_9APHY|nr:hypothetical protein K466DRAFT_564276 [Polyporus arcularius HHB13444]
MGAAQYLGVGRPRIHSWSPSESDSAESSNVGQFSNAISPLEGGSEDCSTGHASGELAEDASLEAPITGHSAVLPKDDTEESDDASTTGHSAGLSLSVAECSESSNNGHAESEHSSDEGLAESSTTGQWPSYSGEYTCTGDNVDVHWQPLPTALCDESWLDPTEYTPLRWGDELYPVTGNAIVPDISHNEQSAVKAKRALPTDDQLDLASTYASQLHHAYYGRPDVGSPLRPRWEKYFKAKIYKLVKLLGAAKFKQLPLVAVACVYQSNLVGLRKQTSIDFEAIHPQGASRPAIDPPEGMRALAYTPTDTGEVPLKAVADIYTEWWKEDVQPLAHAPENPTSLPKHTEDAGAPVASKVSKPRGRPQQAGKEADAMHADSPDEGTRHGSGARSIRGASRATTPTASRASLASSADGDDERDLEDARGRTSGVSTRSGSRSRSLAPSAPLTRDASTASSGKRKQKDGNDEPPNKKVKSGEVPPEDHFPPETIPVTWILHAPQPRPCERKMKCTNKIGTNIKNRYMVAYLAWRYAKQFSNPRKYGTPDPLPKIATEYKDTGVPSWFADQLDAIGGRLELQRPQENETTAEPRTPSPDPVVPGRKKRGRPAKMTLSAATARQPSAESSYTTEPAQASGSGGAPLAARNAPRRSHADDDAMSVDAPSNTEHDSGGEADDRTSEASEPVPMHSTRTAPGKGKSVEAVGTRAPNAREMKMVPPIITDTWRSIPKLASLSPAVPSPASGDCSGDLAQLLAARLAAPAAAASQPVEIGVRPSVSRPRTPPANVFRVGRLTRDMVAYYRTEARHAESFHGKIELLERHLEQVQTQLERRRDALDTLVTLADSPADAVEEFTSHAAGLVDDGQLVAASLASLVSLLGDLYNALRSAMPSSGVLGPVVELLDLVNQLRALYGDSRTKFDDIWKSVQPLWDEVHRVSTIGQSLAARCDALPAECSLAVQPMLLELDRQVTHRMDAVTERIAMPLNRLVSILEGQGSIAADEASAVRTAITEVFQHVAGVQGLAAPVQQLSADVARLAERVSALEAPAGASSLMGPQEPTPRECMTMIATLAERLDRLELQQRDRTGLSSGNIQAHLDDMGLTADVLERLIDFAAEEDDEEDEDKDDDDEDEVYEPDTPVAIPICKSIPLYSCPSEGLFDKERILLVLVQVGLARDGALLIMIRYIGGAQRGYGIGIQRRNCEQRGAGLHDMGSGNGAWTRRPEGLITGCKEVVRHGHLKLAPRKAGRQVLGHRDIRLNLCDEADVAQHQPHGQAIALHGARRCAE